MLFKFSVSLNHMKVFIPLLKAHFQAEVLVGSLSIYVCVYVFISRSLLSKLQSTCLAPGLVKMQILPGSRLGVCISVILSVISAADSCNVHVSFVCFTDIWKRLPKFLD